MGHRCGDEASWDFVLRSLVGLDGMWAPRREEMEKREVEVERWKSRQEIIQSRDEAEAGSWEQKVKLKRGTSHTRSAARRPFDWAILISTATEQMPNGTDHWCM